MSLAFHQAPAKPFDAEEVAPVERSKGLDFVYSVNRKPSLLLKFAIV